MQAFYTTKNFEIRSSGGIEGEKPSVEFVFEHTETTEAGMSFRVHQTIKNGNGSTSPIANFTYPGSKATRRQVCDHYARMAA